MDQTTFADLDYQGKKRRELLLERMDVPIPWRYAATTSGGAGSADCFSCSHQALNCRNWPA